jgi:hypothetical protein
VVENSSAAYCEGFDLTQANLPSGTLYGPDVGDHGIRVVAAEPEHGHVLMAGQKSFLNATRKLAQVSPAIERPEAWRGGMRTVAGFADGMTIAAQAAGDFLAALSQRLGRKRPLRCRNQYQQGDH